MKKIRKIQLMIFIFLLFIASGTFSPAAGEEAKEPIRMGVMLFTGDLSKVSKKQLEAITDAFSNTLANSKSILLVERERLDVIRREHDLNLSGGFDPAMMSKIGKLIGCQYILIGSVAWGNFVTISTRVVDVTTSEVELSLLETASSTKDTSILAASSRLGNRVREALAEEYGYVASINGQNIYINRGATSGVRNGDLYRVYTEGAEIFDMDGTPLGRDIETVAIISVKDVRPNFSIANVLKNGGKFELIRRGDKIETLSPEEAKELTAQKSFIERRGSEKKVAVLPKPAPKKSQSSVKPKPQSVPKKQEQANKPIVVSKQKIQAQPSAPKLKPNSNSKAQPSLKNQKNSAVPDTLFKAAEQGDAEAQFDLARRYANGNGVKKDYSQAFNWYQKAAAQGLAKAQNNLGVFYHDGKGVMQDYAKAMDLYLKAAAQNYNWAFDNIGVMYYNGQGVTQDYKKAVEYYRKAADLGLAIGQNHMGVVYEHGRGVDQDYEKAFEWYKKAADQGFDWGLCNLGNLYAEGQGVKQDYKKAAEYYQKAAGKGLAEAQNRLGYMYRHGNGVKKDPKQAFNWYRKSAEQGYAAGQNNLAVCYMDGIGTTRNPTKAFEWYRKSAAQNNAWAQYNMGIMYEYGQDVSRNGQKSLEYYRKAAAQGNKEAEKALKRLGYKE